MTAPVSRRDLLKTVGLGAGAGTLPGLAGCAAHADEDPRTLSWQAVPSYSLEGSDPRLVRYLRKQVEAFTRSSRYRIKPEVSSSDITAAMAKLLLQASQGRAPDVGEVDSYLLQRFAPYARSLDPWMREAGLSADDWFPPFRNLMTSTGSVRALQGTTDVRALFYRRDLVSEPPRSWDELFRVGQRLARRGKKFVFASGRSEDSVVTAIWPQYWALGGKIVTPDGQPGFASGHGREAMLECLRFVARCIRTGITPRRVASYTKDGDCNADVAAGRAAMFLGGSWQTSMLSQIVGEKQFVQRWGVAPIPSKSGDNHATVCGGWVWTVFASEAHKRRAGMKFIVDTFIGDDAMATWCELGGYLPPRRSVYENPNFHGNTFTPTFRDHLARYADVRPGHRKYQEISNALQIALSSVASGTSTPEAALDGALLQIV